jgi:hypothetical protein
MKSSIYLLILLAAICLLSLKPTAPARLQSSKVVFNPADFKRDFSSYNWKTCLITAKLSELSYDNEDTIRIVVSSINKQYRTSLKYKFIESKGHNNVQLLLAGTKDYCIVAFRGSKEFLDWVADGRIRPYQNIDTVLLKGLASGHAGFRSSMIQLINADIYKQIDTFIRDSLKADPKKIPFYTTGHSYGAALAELFIMMAADYHYNYKGTYAFAPPLAIVSKEAKMISSRYGNVIYDIVNYKDYVTRGGFRGTYSHFGKYFRLCDGVLYHVDSVSYVKYSLHEKTSLQLLKDHRIAHYIEKLSNPVNNEEEVVKRYRNREGQTLCREIN